MGQHDLADVCCPSMVTKVKLTEVMLISRTVMSD